MDDTFYKAYLNIISQQAQDQELDDQELDQTEQTGDEQLEGEEQTAQEQTTQQEQSSQPQTQMKDESADKADLKFSADLASQFGNTVNTFTQVAAKIIKLRTVNKEDSDKIYDLMGKIKDLLDAANKSV